MGRPAREAEVRPEGYLLRVQQARCSLAVLFTPQEGLRRWWRACRMDLSSEDRAFTWFHWPSKELLSRRRRAALLVGAPDV